MEESEDIIKASVDYSLELNYEHMADCSLQVKIVAKDSGRFSLTEQ